MGYKNVRNTALFECCDLKGPFFNDAWIRFDRHVAAKAHYFPFKEGVSFFQYVSL